MCSSERVNDGGKRIQRTQSDTAVTDLMASTSECELF